MIVKLPFPPSTNNLFINVKRGRIRSQKYDEWLKEASWELARRKPPEVTGPVRLAYVFGIPDRRKRDLDNLIKAPQDLLVKFGIIEGDDNTIVYGFTADWDKTGSVQGVQITITPVEAI